MRTNALSCIGRLGYSTVWLFYPAAFGYYTMVHAPNKKAQQVKEEKETLATQIPAKSVDPDLFNPFSAIPFHNNPELKYMYGDVKMFGYIDKN